MDARYAKAEVFNLIGEMVSPHVGDAVGHSVGTAFTKKLGLTDTETLTRDDVDRVLKQLNMALHVFLGAAKANQVHDEVRTAIFNGGRS